MAHLTDMEELVASVQNDQVRDYMSEALSCYMAGAYRATVVLTFIALFDDVLSKLEELGKVNKKAKGVFEDASKKRKDQEVFESTLIDQLKKHALFSALDAGFLDMLRELRNKAAHPSGHHASAEEARFVFHEAISRFLSKPILSTTQLADEVLASFSNENLFPNPEIEAVVEVVKKELVNIHPETYPYVITKAVEKTIGAAEKTVDKNARFFLAGLARLGDPDALKALKKHAVQKMAPNKASERALITLLAANGKLFEGLDEITYQRLAVLIKERIENVTLATEHTKLVHPASLFISLFRDNSPQFVLDKIGPQFDAFLDRFTYSAYFGKKVMTFPVARSKYLDKLNEKAGSNQFNVANKFANSAGDLDKVVGNELLPQESFKLLVHVLRSAANGAWDAVDLKNGHFSATPVIRAKAKEWLANEQEAAEAVAGEILGLGDEDLDEALAFLDPAPDA